jgi:hypothetical protein
MMVGECAGQYVKLADLNLCSRRCSGGCDGVSDHRRFNGITDAGDEYLTRPLALAVVSFSVVCRPRH